MANRLRTWVWLGGSAALAAAGCATPEPIPHAAGPSTLPPSYQSVARSVKPAPTPPKTSGAVVPASAAEPATPVRTPPAYAQLETHGIDLPTVLRLVDENSPTVGFARARVAEAEARLAAAQVQWLPNLTVGGAYNRFDGQTQNQTGAVFGVSRANLFYGGGPALTLDTSAALYGPLVARRVASGERLREAAANLTAEQDAVAAYLDLVQVTAQLAVNAETLRQAEELYTGAKNAKEANLDRTAGDVQRAQTEVLFRRTERLDLEGRAAAASARLARLLYLQPNVKLAPADPVVCPVTLIDPATTLDDLLAAAVNARPDLAANREAIAAAWARVRQAQREPLLPKVVIQNQTGGFGGGKNDDLQNFSGRNALSVQLFWEVRNLGFGNRAGVAERRAVVDQARYQYAETQARAAAEVVEAAQLAAAKVAALDPAERAVKEATDLYRINKEGTANVVDAKNLFDALRPLQAIQALNTAKLNYLAAVSDYNRAQFRLLAAVGTPPSTARPPVLESGEGR